jgi:hypothetical protein
MSERDIVVKTFEAKLDGWHRALDDLDADAATIDETRRDAYRTTVQDIRNQVQQLEKQFTVMKHSTTDDWQDLHAALNVAWGDFETDAKAALRQVTGVDY